MCGLAGILNFNHRFSSLHQLERMGDAIRHRGPDGSGIWSDENIGLIHQRLSIIDTTDAGSQPMTEQSRRYTIVFNGEIYNYLNLKEELSAKGFSFKSNSDTEILLYLFKAYGPSMLNKLNGMFAFAIWDNLKKELFLARDRFGIKPLYFAQDQDSFFFASEPKAIFAAGFPNVTAEKQLNEWLMFRYIAGEKTIFKDIFRILPGHYMTIDTSGNKTTTRWYNLGNRIIEHPKISNPTEWFCDIFHNSVKYRMVSDVPVGILLSGGLDSSSVAASVKYNGFQNIHTFNIGFRNKDYDESSLAKKLSDHLIFPFHSLILEGKSLCNNLLKSTYHLDEPLVHLNDPHLLGISTLAQSKVKVLLSGEGADEMLGGYIRYKAINFIKFQKILKIILRRISDRNKSSRIKKLERYLSIGSNSQLIMTNAANYFESDFEKLGLSFLGINNEYRSNVMEEARKIFPQNLKKQVLYYDQHTYLQSLNDRNDRATMAASIECREPFQDYRLMEGVGALSTHWLNKGNQGKYLLRESFKNILPKYILNHRKIGLAVPWLEQIKQTPELLEYWNEFKNNPETGSELLDRIDIRSIIRNSEQYKEYDLLVLQYFMYFIWRKVNSNASHLN
jgi:asparagine synthase (glutamine-hydrolysing)